MAEQVKIADVKIVGTKGVYDKIQSDSAFREYVNRCVKRFWKLDWGEVSDNLKDANSKAFNKLNDGEYDKVFAIYNLVEVPLIGMNLPMPELHIIREITDADGRQTVTVKLAEER